MKTPKNGKVLHIRNKQFLLSRASDVLKKVYPLSGKMLLDRILKEDNPRELIQSLPQEDFFWLVKKVGDNDCLAVLEMASRDQWQYLLDMELWRRDRLSLDQAFQWLERLVQADPDKLSGWLFGKGQAFAYFYFSKSIQVVIKEEEETPKPDEDFIAFDGIHYFSVIDKRHKERIEEILRSMAEYDIERYRSLLLGLSGVLPAEVEENMYRMRNIRMAEHGFLPFDEALSIYAPLDAGKISSEGPIEKDLSFPDEKIRSLVPLSPLQHVEDPKNLLMKTFSKMSDSLLLDGIRLEFAGLCNQILSADGTVVEDIETLIKTCRKAAGYLNLTLEKLCGEDLAFAESLLRNNSLVSFFRVGFGLALKLKWEAEAWVKKSWFFGHGLEFGFWGGDWGGTLKGLLENKPLFYVSPKKGGGYRDFEKIAELDECGRLIKRLGRVDRLLARLSGLYPLEEGVLQLPDLTFQCLLFNLWARQVLKLEPCFSGISPAQAREFFGRLRAGEDKPPYRVSAFKQNFIRDFVSFVPSLEAEDEKALKETLSLVWEEFVEEYQWVSAGDLDGRFTKFILITP